MRLLVIIDNKVVELESGCVKHLYSGSNGNEYYVFSDKDEAGKEAREYYDDMVSFDPEEFKYMVGTEALISWCLGRFALGVSSLDEYLDSYLDNPERQWASYDGSTIDICQMNQHMKNEMNNNTCVAYRCN
jgi:hypothetical protein